MIKMECEEECKKIGYCPYMDLFEEGEPCEPERKEANLKEYNSEVLL